MSETVDGIDHWSATISAKVYLDPSNSQYTYEGQ